MKDKDDICKHCGGKIERCWIDSPEDHNCVHVSIAKHGKHTLDQVSKRLGTSLVNAFQIEKRALRKLKKKMDLKIFLNRDTN